MVYRSQGRPSSPVANNEDVVCVLETQDTQKAKDWYKHVGASQFDIIHVFLAGLDAAASTRPRFLPMHTLCLANSLRQTFSLLQS